MIFFSSVKLYHCSTYDKMINTNILVGLQISIVCGNGEHILTPEVSPVRLED